MEEELIAVSAEDTFCFTCHNEVPCFNQCCADLNQFLYPYDILRLKNHLGLTDYNRFNDKLLDLISLKNRRLSGPLDLKARRLFHLALYDLETFRRQLFDDGFYRQLPLDPQDLEAARNEDTILLTVGIEWIKISLFGESEDARGNAECRRGDTENSEGGMGNGET